MSDYVRACAIADIPEVGAIAVEIGDTPVAIVRSDGAIYAIYDVCSHGYVPLSEGDVEGTTIECWLHGSRFDLTTGQPTGLPAFRPVPVYPTKIDGDDVYVSINQES